MSPVVEELKKEALRRIFAESIPRIKKCLNLLSEEQTWQTPNKNIPSIGNLILHLCGNSKQWILSGIGDKQDSRERDKEFEKNNYSIAELTNQLKELEVNLRPEIESITEEQLIAINQVQCFEESGTAILVHVIEHFSYHTGQITTLTKLMLNKDLGYYANLNLN